MTLTSGTRLGPYEIVSALGAGGMGEVYRARDARLKRDVAIKILTAEFASHPDRLARFERVRSWIWRRASGEFSFVVGAMPNIWTPGIYSTRRPGDFGPSG